MTFPVEGRERVFVFVFDFFFVLCFLRFFAFPSSSSSSLEEKKKLKLHSHHKVPDLLPGLLVRDPRLPVRGHHAPTSEGAHAPAQVRLARRAHAALAAKGLVAGDDGVSRLAGRDPFSHGLDDPGGLVAQNAGEEPLWVVAVEGVGVGVAEGGGDDLSVFFSYFFGLKKSRVEVEEKETVVTPLLDEKKGKKRERERESTRTLMRTSPFCGGAIMTSVTSRGLLASHATAARHSIGCFFFFFGGG